MQLRLAARRQTTHVIPNKAKAGFDSIAAKLVRSILALSGGKTLFDPLLETEGEPENAIQRVCPITAARVKDACLFDGRAYSDL